MWRCSETGEREFLPGRDNWSAAALAARDCAGFVLDVDEELVADEPRSCYNCRYRRWSANSFTCQHKF